MTIKHFVYRTTNIVNGKFYIGVHSCKSYSCNYLGSGVALKAAVKKYGKDNFTREILKSFNDRESACEYEKQSIILSSQSYNIKVGGDVSGGSYSPCYFNNKYFESQQAAAEYFSVRPNTIIDWLDRGYYKLKHQLVIIEGRIFKSRAEAARYYDCSKSTITNWIKDSTKSAQVMKHPTYLCSRGVRF